MSAWVSMPTDAAATRQAAVRNLQEAHSAIRCAVDLLSETVTDARDRELLAAVLSQVTRAAEALTEYRILNREY